MKRININENQCVLEDSANGDVELSLAVWTRVATILANVGMGAATVGAYCFAITPTLLGDSCSALVLSIEIVNEGDE